MLVYLVAHRGAFRVPHYGATRHSAHSEGDRVEWELFAARLLFVSWPRQVDPPVPLPEADLAAVQYIGGDARVCSTATHSHSKRGIEGWN